MESGHDDDVRMPPSSLASALKKYRKALGAVARMARRSLGRRAARGLKSSTGSCCLATGWLRGEWAKGRIFVSLNYFKQTALWLHFRSASLSLAVPFSTLGASIFL